jgi:hypothetical protein
MALCNPAGKSRRIPLERLQMLVDLYFPELKAKYQVLERGRDALGKHVADSIVRREAPHSERSAILAELTSTHKQAHDACESFLSAASDLFKRFL